MTGGEIAAASAAAKGAKKVLSEDETTKAQLVRLSEDTPEMRAAASAYAKRVAIRQQVVLQIMRPLGRLAGFSKEYFENEFSEDIAAKLSEVPDDQVQSPPANIAVPAMQALGYSLDEPDLKEMYLNLLANASDKRKADGAHPAFSEVVRQLSSAEASFLGHVLRYGMLPMVKVKITTPSGEGFQIVMHSLIQTTNTFTDEPSEMKDLGTWIDNWARLGLVERDFANHFTDADRYSWTDGRPEVLRLREAGKTVSFDKGILRVTEFGRRFAVAVGSDARADAELERYRRAREVAREHSESVGGEGMPSE